MTHEGTPHLQYRTTGGVTVVGFTSPYLQADEDIEKVGNELFDLVDNQGHTKLVLSFQGIRYVSSSMLAQVVKLHKKLAKAKGKLRICHLAPQMKEVLHASQLDRMLEIFEDEAAALNKI